MISCNDIRRLFLEYFARNGHEIVPSSPLVPHNDPTLLFTNAGMVQFKDVFTGNEVRPYTRAATSQKCVRAGGKHNDLENVGYTARHHTFFEMLGNFSFGDYFKEEAISFAWELVTKELGLTKDRLLVTVYAEDQEATELWKKIAGLPTDRIIPIATSDNFWSMGDKGPCGPCSEIFYDHGADIPGGPPGSPDEDGDRFIEIWNLVFMQYDQLAPGQRVDLPKPSIDTGMGLERIAAVLQGVHDNYDIDLFRALIEASAEISGVAADGSHAVSHRVIADHLRASSFLMADGVLPSNEGRGYVLRRIMRRAMRHAHILGAKDPMMHKLVPELIAQMGQAYPELMRAAPLITETLLLEESRFKDMLARGLRLLDEELSKLGTAKTLPGEIAFKLYDTYGFPLDLTQDILRGLDKKVDATAFDVAMERQRAAARKAWSGSGDMTTDKIWYDLKEKFGATEFLGYETEQADAQVIALLRDGKEVESASAGDEIMILTNQTPFYGEGGGQIGDRGVGFAGKGTEIAISDTKKKLGDIIVHIAQVQRGTVSVGDNLHLRVEGDRRTALRSSHSATHLLHEALRRTLGEHVTQKGSLVAPDRLRFDFSHPKPLTDEDLHAIEKLVNDEIRANEKVITRLLPPSEAIEAGALALFGEKYGDEVRVVAMGTPREDKAGKAYSIELCGGIHVKRTGDIGLFKIISEQALSSGVRRIEAVTGRQALEAVQKNKEVLDASLDLLRVSQADLPKRISSLLDEKRKLERENEELRRKLITSAGKASGGQQKDEAVHVNGARLVTRVLHDIPAKDLKPLADDLKQQIGSGITVLIAVNEGKASLVVGVTDDLTPRFSAIDLVRKGAEALGGKGGGGRADMAQAGGPDGAKAEDAVQAIQRYVEEQA